MQGKVKDALKMSGKVGVAGALLLASGLTANLALAQVVGGCANCHTMHNSFNNQTQVVVREATTGTVAAWNGASITGGATPTLGGQGQLLKYDCVGCHTNTGTATIVNGLGGNTIPIVYNTGASYPNSATTATTPLAGGNFAGVTLLGSNYGHNVRGISTTDAVLTTAPGKTASGCGISCHDDLTLTDAATNPPTSMVRTNGCQACHLHVGHHKDPADAAYRYLGGHGAPGMTALSTTKVTGDSVGGVNGDWEQTKSDTDHNIYNANTSTGDRTTMAAFCSGCHGMFHAPGGMPVPDYLTGQNNGGDPNTDGKIVANSTPPNPWMRHPSGARIPNDGEYATLFTVPNNAYNPTIPVANLAGAGSPNIIDVGDQVFCLSCHRAHGSQYPDALRFQYDASSTSAHSYVSEQTNGCFYCHRNKDI